MRFGLTSTASARWSVQVCGGCSWLTATPEFTALLTCTPVPGTALAERIASGQADLPSARGSLEEIKAFVEALDVRTYFTCNHAGNHLPMTGRMPQAKARMLGDLDAALAGQLPMTPEHLRGL